MPGELTAIDALTARLEASEQRRRSAFDDAYGLGVDHPETPSMIAGVRHNRLVQYEIHQSLLDEYRDRPLDLAIYVNAVIRAAFADWRTDVAKRAGDDNA